MAEEFWKDQGRKKEVVTLALQYGPCGASTSTRTGAVISIFSAKELAPLMYWKMAWKPVEMAVCSELTSCT